MLRLECIRSCCGSGGGAFLDGGSVDFAGCDGNCGADGLTGRGGGGSGDAMGGVVVGVVMFSCTNSWMDGTDGGVGTGTGFEV